MPVTALLPQHLIHTAGVVVTTNGPQPLKKLQTGTGGMAGSQAAHLVISTQDSRSIRSPIDLTGISGSSGPAGTESIAGTSMMSTIWKFSSAAVVTLTTSMTTGHDTAVMAVRFTVNTQVRLNLKGVPSEATTLTAVCQVWELLVLLRKNLHAGTIFQLLVVLYMQLMEVILNLLIVTSPATMLTQGFSNLILKIQDLVYGF